MPYGVYAPGVVTEPVAQAEDSPRRVAGNLHVVELAPLVARADEVLQAVLRPLDGPAEPHRRVGDQDLLGVEEHDLRAEAAAGVRDDDLHVELRQPEDPRQAVLDGERRLGRRPHAEVPGPRIVLRHDAARLDRAAAAPLDVELLGQDVGRLPERRVRVARPLGDARRAVPRHVRMDARSLRLRRHLEIGDHRQRLVRDVDEPHGILGHVAVVRHHEGDELPRVAHLVDRERPLRARVREARMRDEEGRGLIEVAELGGGQDQVHTGHRAGARRVDRRDARVRMRRPQAGSVEDPAGLDVVDERPQPPQEPRILVSRDARTDQAGRHGWDRRGAKGRPCLRARDLSTGRRRRSHARA